MFFVYRTTGLLLEVDIHPHSISEKTKRKEYKFQGVSKKKKKYVRVQNLGKRGRR